MLRVDHHTIEHGPAVRERPILFQGAMIRALLAGLKTQTRRAVQDQLGLLPSPATVRPHHDGTTRITAYWGAVHRVCPYGQPGDRLWVRETCRAEELPDGADGVRYLADDHFRPIEDAKGAADQWVALHHYRGGNGGGRLGLVVPGIHMPRWASRITLEITEVRVERLQDINEADAKAEGSDPLHWVDPIDPVDRTAFDLIDWPLKEQANPHRNGYAMLWESINGRRPGLSWDANPWVWAVSFRRIKP